MDISKDGENVWNRIQIDPTGETLLPSGLIAVRGIVQPPFKRVIAENNDQAPPVFKFTNQLEFLKRTLSEKILGRKEAIYFAAPVDSVDLCVPHYYKVIRQPMDLGTVKRRLDHFWYSNATECVADLRLIFANCYAFNASNHAVYKAGKKLEKYLNDKLKEMPAKEVEILCPPSSTLAKREKALFKQDQKPIKLKTPTVSRAITQKLKSEPVVNEVKVAKLNKPMSCCLKFVKSLFKMKHAMYAYPFLKPVDLQEYPDYLTVIKRPMDLTTIKTKLESGQYTKLEEYAKDMQLMLTNCLRYSPLDNPIIKKAQKLREEFEYHFAQLPDEQPTLPLKLVLKCSGDSYSITFNSLSPSSAKRPYSFDDNNGSPKRHKTFHIKEKKETFCLPSLLSSKRHCNFNANSDSYKRIKSSQTNVGAFDMTNTINKPYQNNYNDDISNCKKSPLPTKKFFVSASTKNFAIDLAPFQACKKPQLCQVFLQSRKSIATPSSLQNNSPNTMVLCSIFSQSQLKNNSLIMTTKQGPTFPDNLHICPPCTKIFMSNAQSKVPPLPPSTTAASMAASAIALTQAASTSSPVPAPSFSAIATGGNSLMINVAVPNFTPFPLKPQGSLSGSRVGDGGVMLPTTTALALPAVPPLPPPAVIPPLPPAAFVPVDGRNNLIQERERQRMREQAFRDREAMAAQNTWCLTSQSDLLNSFVKWLEEES